MAISQCFIKSVEKIETTNMIEKSENVTFIPDTSINEKLYLHNVESVIKELRDVSKLRDKDADLPDVYFLNREKKQYLRLVFFPGGTANSVSQFEFGYTSQMKKETIRHNSTFISFHTESNIKLGQSIEEIIKIKGAKYSKETQKNATIKLKYEISELDNSQFLRRYNMPLYYMELEFKKNKLVRCRYGFEYP
jgi:hypothetical protein